MADTFLQNLKHLGGTADAVEKTTNHILSAAESADPKLSAQNYEGTGKQTGHRLAVGNNRLTEGDIPAELNLTRALRMRQSLITSMPYQNMYGGFLPKAIYTPGQQINGGGDIEGGAAVDVMRHLEVNPDVNYRRLASIYAGLRSELLRKTGKQVDDDFDKQMLEQLDNIRKLEREVREKLVKMNLVQHLAPFTNNKDAKWDDANLSQEASDAIKEFTKLESLKTTLTLNNLDLLIRFGAAIGRL